MDCGGGVGRDGKGRSAEGYVGGKVARLAEGHWLRDVFRVPEAEIIFQKVVCNYIFNEVGGGCC